MFTHGDLSPRNIIVLNDKIVGIVDWEEAGWFPEYWEYVKFFLRIDRIEIGRYMRTIFSPRYTTTS